MPECVNLTGHESLPKTIGLSLYLPSLALMIVAAIYFPASFWYFSSNRNSFEKLLRRNYCLLLISLIGYFGTVINFCARNVIGPRDYNCFVYYLASTVSAICILFGPLFRLIRLNLKISFNKKLLETTFSALLDGQLVFQVGKPTFTRASIHRGETAIPVDHAALSNMSLQIKPLRQANTIKGSSLSSLFKKFLFHSFCWKVPPGLPTSIELSCFFASDRFITGICVLSCFVFGMPLLLTFLSTLSGNYQCSGCSLEANARSVGVLFFLTGLVMTFLIYKMRREHDTLGIKTELTVINGLFIGFSCLIVFPASLILDEVETSGNWQWRMLTVLQMFFLTWYSFVHQVNISKHLKNRPVHRETIENILENVQGTQAFALYLAVHLSIENLYFYKAVQIWKSSFSDHTREENLKFARSICAQYIGSRSIFQLNLNTRTEQNLLTTLECQENFARDVFDDALAESLTFITGEVFQSFLRSPYYEMYTNNLRIQDIF